MITPDIVNGLFECVGGLAIWLNVAALRRDRVVRGVDWRVMFFFTTWGLWNLFYYPSLGQWASFAGGLVIATGNVAWVVLVIRYRLASPARPRPDGPAERR